MTIRKLLALAVAAATIPTGASAAVTPTLINFDVDGNGKAIASGTAITTQYQNLGVTFAGIEDGGAAVIQAGRDPDYAASPSSPNVLTNCVIAAGACPSSRADILRISFVTPVSQIGLLLNTLGSNPVTFNLYDAIGNLLETQSAASPNGTYRAMNFTAAGVSRIDGVQPTDTWAWVMDNLSFSATPAVPEPATWAMMMLGFGVVGGALRRSRNEGAHAQLV